MTRWGWQPPGRPHRPRAPVGDVGQSDLEHLGQRLSVLIQVQSQDRATQHTHGQSARFGIEINRGALTPAVADRGGSFGHVSPESRYLVASEYRLQGPLARAPRRVGQVGEVVAQ